MSIENLQGLFAPIEPFHHGFLPLEDGHSVYFEECGNPQGVPVIFLHGGPGSGCSPRHRQLFDPQLCRAVLFDQRACGRSKAHDPLFNNDTPHLIHDMERLRRHLAIDHWLVVGGSWGGGLALAYASLHPEVFSGAILRNTFLSRQSDLQWFFQDARQVMPDAWEALVKPIPAQFRDNLGYYLYSNILGTDKDKALVLALAWRDWENALLQRTWTAPSPLNLSDNEIKSLLLKYTIQSHYLEHLCFFPDEGVLAYLEQCNTIPIDLLQGRLDWVCRPESSWDIHCQLPHSRLQWIDQAGHGLFETPMVSCMTQTIRQRVSLLQQSK